MSKKMAKSGETEQFQKLFEKLRGAIDQSRVNGFSKVKVTTAIELSNVQKTQIQSIIKSDEFKAIHFLINKSILGGLQVIIGDWKFDGSLKTQLRLLSSKLLE